MLRKTEQVVSFGSLFKTLKIDFPANEFGDNLHLLILNFPAVEKLCWRQDGDSFEEIYLALEMSRYKWSNMKYMNDPTNYFHCISYADVAIRYRATLQKLSLSDSLKCIYNHIIARIDEENYEGLYSRLDQFPKLKDLTIKRYTHDGIEAFDSVFARCSFLEILNIGICPRLNLKEQLSTTSRETIDLSTVMQRPKSKYWIASLKYIKTFHYHI